MIKGAVVLPDNARSANSFRLSGKSSKTSLPIQHLTSQKTTRQNVISKNIKRGSALLPLFFLKVNVGKLPAETVR
jgi:acyl CoA:acetate/3-ketoacid CoA transferase alpha subunit